MENFRLPRKPSPELNQPKRIKYYNEVSSAASFKERAARGSMSTVLLSGDHTVSKSDPVGGTPLVAREYIILKYLGETGAVPIIDEDTGLFGYPLTFTMDKINNGATLEDWLAAYSSNPHLIEVFPELLENIVKGIHKIWQKGVIHGDLHLNNVVISMVKGGHRFDPKIIDFGISQMDENELEKLAKKYGVWEDFKESQTAFQREVNSRYEDKEGEIEFLITEVDDFINCKDIRKLLTIVKDELGSHTRGR